MTTRSLRSIRIEDAVWTAALAKARDQGTTLTAVITSYLKAYIATGDATSRSPS